MNGSVHSHTPVLNVIDGRGLPVRQVSYHRARPGQASERRAQLTRHDAGQQSRAHWDARLAGRIDQGVLPNQRVIAALSGAALLSENADAGWRLGLLGDAGQPVARWDGRNSLWLTTFDPRLRPVVVHEIAEGKPERAAERFVYGDARSIGGNRCGQLVRHDDAAGSRLIDCYSLTGQPRNEARRFLGTLDMPHWPEPVAEREALLEPGDGAETAFVHGPLNDLLERTDALGNCQRWRFALSGELASASVALAGTPQQLLLTGMQYTAAGQIERQTAGNGVTRHAQYDPADGRLRRMCALRAGRAVLQDFVYGYDRVGNVVRVKDLSQPVSHFANQRVEPVSTFAYDSFSQLIEATGREAAGAMIGPGLPALVPSPGDTSRLLNYRQCYAYDASGNLLSLEHSGHQSYTRRIAVAPDSNHALQWEAELPPENPRAGFDANGNQLSLQPGQPLYWNALNRLHGIRVVSRQGAPDDEEQYRYGGDGLRIRKVVRRNVAGRMQWSEVRYLPGLELRDREGGQVAIITVQAGLVAVRCLVGTGAPPQLRYSLADVFDSSELELDGEGRIISHEGYYPFGGTAWWAGRSAVEAGGKVRRYAGKERDATGLYDYGLRYYAPWLARWISPDPAGDVDGLNRFVFAGSNPVTINDRKGLVGSPKPGDRVSALEAIERRRRFVSEQFTHEFSDDYPPSPNTVISVYLEEERMELNRFVSTFKPHKWTFKDLSKETRGATFFTSDVIRHQFLMASRKHGFDGTFPQRIKHKDVINEETLKTMSGIQTGSKEMMDVFFRDTPNGKLTRHLLNDFGLHASGVTMSPIVTEQNDDGSWTGKADIHIELAATPPDTSASREQPGIDVQREVLEDVQWELLEDEWPAVAGHSAQRR